MRGITGTAGPTSCFTTPHVRQLQHPPAKRISTPIFSTVGRVEALAMSLWKYIDDVVPKPPFSLCARPLAWIKLAPKFISRGVSQVPYVLIQGGHSSGVFFLLLYIYVCMVLDKLYLE